MRRPALTPPTESVEDLRSRTDLKRANRVVEETLARLSQALYDVGPRRLAALALPEAVHETVMEAFAIKNPRALHRQLGLVRVALRNADWAAIQERVSRHAEGRKEPVRTEAEGAPAAGEEAVWISRLLGEGFVGLDAFLTEFPRADRARLVELIRNVDRSSHDRRLKAERKLADTIRSFLRSRVPL